jgi:methylmalonyl-CoA/ethylmalonyl-CoA epimerase
LRTALSTAEHSGRMVRSILKATAVPPMIFHHIGLACRDLEQAEAIQTLLGYRAEGPTFEDPLQQVRLRFMVGGGPRLELLSPLSAQSPVAKILARGARLYHQAYVVADLEVGIATLRAHGFKLTVAPVAAVAFALRRIAFLLAPTLDLIELIEAARVEKVG